MKKNFIIANWKMSLGHKQALELADNLLKQTKKMKPKIVKTIKVDQINNIDTKLVKFLLYAKNDITNQYKLELENIINKYRLTYSLKELNEIYDIVKDKNIFVSNSSFFIIYYSLISYEYN